MAVTHRLALIAACTASAATAQVPWASGRSAPDLPIVPGQRGLWIGSIHLCRDNVVSAVRMTDPEGIPIVRFTFAPEMQPRLKDETRRFEAQQLPVRIDGRPIAAPFMEEPIVGLELDLHGGDQQSLKRIAAAARLGCVRGARR